MEASAIILCAGKGTRMGDDAKNKVCFDCAGIPVIKRITANMRKGGIRHFVIVVGHKAESVMSCLDGEEGVIYAYQKEQKGTGHAALCGLKALSSMGFSGPVIISAGDKIVSADVISGLIAHAEDAKVVWCVQPRDANFSGGRVMTDELGRPCGIVEFADAALSALASVEPEDYDRKLKEIGLNAKKSAAVKEKALKHKPSGVKVLNGRTFTADEILNAGYSNAGLYQFDIGLVTEAAEQLTADNAQGEMYLTDVLEHFAKTEEARLFEIPFAGDLLTYSTKPELCRMSRSFMRTASRFASDIGNGRLDDVFVRLYAERSGEQKTRYLSLLKKFIEKYGDRKVVITRSPGRVNLMGRHIDHRGGGVNAMAIDKDTVFVSSPREDDTVRTSNLDPSFPDGEFSISGMLAKAPHDSWREYICSGAIVNEVQAHRGDWTNYVKGAVLRAQLASDFRLCGADVAADGNIPVAAGLSSSSSIVVACLEAAVALNCLNITDAEFINLCGEGEWFVGSRGGSGDHATMKCARRDRIIHLDFKPFSVGATAGFSEKYAVLVVDSGTSSRKSEGSRDTFNAKVAAYEFSFMLIKRMFPIYGFREFRDIIEVRPFAEIYRMIRAIPETVTRSEIREMLPEYAEKLNEIFADHADPGRYELRGVTLFGVSECARSEMFMRVLEDGDYEKIGRMMKTSHEGDRINDTRISDEMLDRLIEENADIALQCGKYSCSTRQIDGLCDLLNGTDGVLGSEIAGAGLGGCVIALVERSKAEAVIEMLDREYYDKNNLPRSAYVCFASHGSSAIF